MITGIVNVDMEPGGNIAPVAEQKPLVRVGYEYRTVVVEFESGQMFDGMCLNALQDIMKMVIDRNKNQFVNQPITLMLEPIQIFIDRYLDFWIDDGRLWLDGYIWRFGYEGREGHKRPCSKRTNYPWKQFNETDVYVSVDDGGFVFVRKDDVAMGKGSA